MGSGRDRASSAGIRSALTDGPAWRALLYLLLKVPVGLLAMLVFLFWVYGLALLAYSIWYRSSRNVDGQGVERSGVVLGDITFTTWPRIGILMGVGLAVLLAAPWATRGLVAADVALVRGLLGPTRADHLEHSRNRAVDELGRPAAAHRARSARRRPGPAGRPGHEARTGQGGARRR